MKKLAVFITILFTSTAHAKIDELTGTVYPIAERNLIEVIKERLNNMEKLGEIDKLQHKQEKSLNEYLHGPIGIKLPRNSSTKSYVLDPSYTTTKPVLDQKDRVITPVGYTVNPLDHVRLEQRLVFVNGFDDEQVAWLKALIEKHDNLKIILTSGNPIELIEELQKNVYFDQQAKLVKKFQISGLPAIISQKGNKILVREIAI